MLPGRDEHQALIDFWNHRAGMWKAAFTYRNNLENAKNYLLVNLIDQ